MELSSTHKLIHSAIEELSIESQADISLDIDEVVFSYIAGILEEESVSDIDMEEFISIMDAYVPGFVSMQVDAVKRFLKRLEVKISMQRVTAKSETLPEAPKQVPACGGKSRRRNRRTSHRQSSESEASMASSPPVTSSEIALRGLQQRTLSEASSGDQERLESSENYSTNLSNLGIQVFGSHSLSENGDSLYKGTDFKSHNDLDTNSKSAGNLCTNSESPSDSRTNFESPSDSRTNFESPSDSHTNFEGPSDLHTHSECSSDVLADSASHGESKIKPESTNIGDFSGVQPDCSDFKDLDNGTKVKNMALGDPKASPDLEGMTFSRKPGKSLSETEVDELMETRIEMFPDKSKIDLENSLQFNCNNLEATVVCLLDEGAPGGMVIRRNHKPSGDGNIIMRQASAKSSKQKKHSKASRKKSNSQSCDEAHDVEPVLDKLAAAEIKSLIVSKYSYIPTDAEEKTYNPKLQTNDVKKMVRYRNGQVVSTKGERYSDAKPALTDEMKKTYINLKPAKQYRFH